MGNNNYSKHFFLAALLALGILTVIILWPLLVPLMAAGILAYIFYPVYKWLLKRVKNRHVSAWIVIILVFFIITLPLFFVAEALTKEGYTFFISVKQKLSSDSLTPSDCSISDVPLCEQLNSIIGFLGDPQVKFYLEDGIAKLLQFVVTQTSQLLINIPSILLGLFVMFFATYYLLIDGTKFFSKVKASVPLKTHHVDDIIKQFDDFTYATLYGNTITAIVQGLVGGIIFWILGLNTPVLAGLAMAFFSFVPFVGTPIIWVPTAISLLITGDTTKGILLLLLGLFIISTIDNFLKPMIIGQRTKLHPAFVLIGIIGGIFMIGPLGIIIGPLVISLLISFIEVYYKEGY